jgi:hypothetical protein
MVEFGRIGDLVEVDSADTLWDLGFSVTGVLKVTVFEWLVGRLESAASLKHVRSSSVTSWGGVDLRGFDKVEPLTVVGMPPPLQKLG